VTVKVETMGRLALRIATLVALATAARSAVAKPEAHHVVEQDVNLEDEPDESTDGEKEPDEEPATKTVRAPKAKDAPTKKSEDDEPAPAPRDERGASTTPDPAVWLSLGLVQDFAFLSGSQVCTEQSQVSGGFTCVRGGGSQYHGTPLPGAAGSVSGVALAATRVTLAAYVRVTNSISAGVRLGGAFLGRGPRPDGGKSFLWFSGEAQGAYWLSRRAFSTRVVGTFLELSTGLAQIDGKAKVTVTENQTVPPPVSQLDNPPQQSLDASRKSGAGFVGAGAGVFFPFGGGGGLLADLRVLQLFPSSGTALSLGVSGALGL
jgi:hypothetical protein